MKTKHRLLSPFNNTISLAGWLFADLFLGLVMVFLVTNTSKSESLPIPTPTPQPTQLASLGRVPLKTSFKVDVDSLVGNAALTAVCPPATPTPKGLLIPKCPTRQELEQARIRRLLRERLGSVEGKRFAGFILTTGTAPTSEEDISGMLAREVNRLLGNELPSVIQRAALRTFIQDDEDPKHRGIVELEIYWLYDT